MSQNFEFAANASDISKIELNGSQINVAIKVKYKSVDISLLLLNVPQSFIPVLANAKAGSQVYFRSTEPVNNPPDKFYTASYGGKIELRM